MDSTTSSDAKPARRLGRMSASRKIFVAGLSAVIAISTASVAAAVISSSTSVTQQIAAPPSVKLNALENATKVNAFDERQGVTLASAVAVDAVNPGAYSTFPSGSVTIPVGTVVDSHLIHSDIPSRNYTSHRVGTVTFSSDIIGVVASTARLASSDSALGAVGTQYAGTTQFRGLESSGSSSEGTGVGQDKFTISADKRTVSYDLNTLLMDEIRVITRHAFTTTVTDSPDPVQAGDNVTYTVTVTNNGSTTASSVQVKDQFPGTFVSATVTTGTGTCTAPVSATTTCTLGTIAAGGSGVATIVVKSPNTGATITNTATAPPVGGTPVSQSTTVVPPPTLSTLVEGNPDTVTVGLNVQYTLTVTNTGTTPVADAHVIDTLPDNTALQSTTPPTGFVCTGSAVVDCDLGPLGVGESQVAKLLVRVPLAVPAGGSITNSAKASPGPSNNTGSVTTTIEPKIDGVAKGFVSPAGSLTIDSHDPATITLPNSGPGAGVEITQGAGTFCNGPCVGPATTISDFSGYSDPSQPLTARLEYNYPDPSSSNAAIIDAATAYGATIYKDLDPTNPSSTTFEVVNTCPVTPLGSRVAGDYPCVSNHTIYDSSTLPGELSPGEYRVIFDIQYLSGDPKLAKH